MTVSLDRVRALRPGERIDVWRTVDIGPVRGAARATPQQAQRIKLLAVLDAQSAESDWIAGPMGQSLEQPVYFNRLPAQTGSLAMSALLANLAAEDAAARFAAISTAAQLVGEAQRAALRRLNYAPAPVPTERLTRGLVDALQRDDAESRVRALEALMSAGLDRALLTAAEGCLSHPDWLVRLMAVKLVARQGSTMRPAFERIVQADGDEFVRAVAGAYVTVWSSPATTQPAEGE